MPAQIPIIFHHGFMDILNLKIRERGIYSFMGIKRHLAAQGKHAFRTRVHPSASIPHRAAQLREQLLKILGDYPPGTRALIIAHSMGGLDARFMLSNLDMADKVAALLTVGTPHRGTCYADYALRNLSRFRITPLLKFLSLDLAAVSDLTTEACRQFNKQTPDAPNVKYFSISAQCDAHDLPPWSRRPHRIISEKEGPNDGLVSVHSATYANHLGTWPVSHWVLLNKQIRRSTSRSVIDRYVNCIEQILPVIQ